MPIVNSLPGSELIAAGINDLRHQRVTIPALLVAIGAPKLRSLGLVVPEILPSNPEHHLYDLLSADEPDSAHARYNALIRRLVSFERALPCVKMGASRVEADIFNEFREIFRTFVQTV